MILMMPMIIGKMKWMNKLLEKYILEYIKELENTWQYEFWTIS